MVLISFTLRTVIRSAFLLLVALNILSATLSWSAFVEFYHFLYVNWWLGAIYSTLFLIGFLSWIVGGRKKNL